MRESRIEQYLRRRVEECGGVCLKYSNGNRSGYPDRICLMPGGVTFWVELKATGRKPRKLQEIRIQELRDIGQSVHVADSTEEIDRLIDIYT